MTFDEQKKCYMPKKRKNSLSKSSVKETLKENAAGGLHLCSGNHMHYILMGRRSVGAVIIVSLPSSNVFYC